MATAKNNPVITIDGVKYDPASLSKEARAALANLGAVDSELKRLQVQVGIARIARAEIAKQVKAALPNAA